MRSRRDVAIEKGDSDSMHNLALYYKNIKDSEMMKFYFLIAIEKGKMNEFIRFMVMDILNL